MEIKGDVEDRIEKFSYTVTRIVCVNVNFNWSREREERKQQQQTHMDALEGKVIKIHTQKTRSFRTDDSFSYSTEYGRMDRVRK